MDNEESCKGFITVIVVVTSFLLFLIFRAFRINAVHARELKAQKIYFNLHNHQNSLVIHHLSKILNSFSRSKAFGNLILLYDEEISNSLKYLKKNDIHAYNQAMANAYELEKAVQSTDSSKGNETNPISISDKVRRLNEEVKAAVDPEKLKEEDNILENFENLLKDTLGPLPKRENKYQKQLEELKEHGFLEKGEISDSSDCSESSCEHVSELDVFSKRYNSTLEKEGKEEQRYLETEEVSVR